MNPYVPLLLVLFLAAAVPAALLVLSRLLCPPRAERAKGEPYECGIPQPNRPRRRIPVKFYLVAVLFLLFDVEAAFLYPWAAIFRTLGAAGLAEMAVFLGMLLVGFVYVWKRGALEWR